ncbi:hypothetical protein CCR94_17220 [Rhodoblastus sphagnicola]|uniref:HNH nuclease domain-containing protein n=1 Tax=Rhodoblastus sphagnicola TaxID=333368 RepID=A0A2S6N223_9HYPH|nr:HNH endonuclease [Rhodoblastus sphagnicola]MBB4199723.1 hypothetical protein [Rhodoblastus sphagnicola]PPQ28663.1 hypothetical protein CCR94_17220 [Rhodoblastus sphagnicola]
MANGDIVTLPITLPDFTRGQSVSKKVSQPFSKSSHQRYRVSDLKYPGEGNTPRTDFFEKHLTAIYWVCGTPVPYVFKTIDGATRSLDAGCLSFMLHQGNKIDLILDADGYIAAVRPLPKLLDTYTAIKEKLVGKLTGDSVEILDLPFDLNAPVDERRKQESELVVREGASAFRAAVLGAWSGKCAVSGSGVVEVIDAAHIYPYLGPKTNRVCNGVPLRADIHRLFDDFRISFRSDPRGFRVVLADDLKQSEYAQYEDRVLLRPPRVAERPAQKLVEFHLTKFKQRNGT